LGSTNGTLVDGQRITSTALAEGDRISIGMTDFVFTQR
jgi:pSer/pThr/pTyr-binding forkhead associated (FHA) protein